MLTAALFAISESGKNPDAHRQLVEGQVNGVRPHTALHGPEKDQSADPRYGRVGARDCDATRKKARQVRPGQFQLREILESVHSRDSRRWMLGMRVGVGRGRGGITRDPGNVRGWTSSLIPFRVSAVSKHVLCTLKISATCCLAAVPQPSPNQHSLCSWS